MRRPNGGLQMLGVVALCCSFVLARALLSARSEWNAAQSALTEQRAELALGHLRRAASWHVPLSPYTALAQEALRDLEHHERVQGREHNATWARRAQESAHHASRTLKTRLLSDPNAGFTLLALLGWLTWSAAAFRFVFVGLDREGRPVPRAYASAVAMAVGFALFTLGLALA